MLESRTNPGAYTQRGPQQRTGATAEKMQMGPRRIAHAAHNTTCSRCAIGICTQVTSHRDDDVDPLHAKTKTGSYATDVQVKLMRAQFRLLTAGLRTRSARRPLRALTLGAPLLPSCAILWPTRRRASHSSSVVPPHRARCLGSPRRLARPLGLRQCRTRTTGEQSAERLLLHALMRGTCKRCCWPSRARGTPSRSILDALDLLGSA